MWIRRVFSVSIMLSAGLGLVGCMDEQPNPTGVEPTSSAEIAVVQDSEVPPRSYDGPAGGFVEMSDSLLWNYVAASDRTVFVGLKAPGRNRGFWRGKVLLNGSEWEDAQGAVTAQSGVTLISADTLLPTVKVRLDNIEALRATRKLPVVDYVQPVLVESGLGSMWAGSGGCGYKDLWSGGNRYTANGDLFSASFQAMGIDNAWRRSGGAGVNIGLTDTGISYYQAAGGEFYSGSTTSTGFASGDSGGRFIELRNIGAVVGPYDECGHGTEMAGVLAAPKNGSSVVGVAWKANLVSVKQANGVASVDSDDAQQSVRLAAQSLINRSGGKIIVMAWQSLNYLYQVSDEIRHWHDNYPILFVAAAGSDPNHLVPDGNVTFPGDMAETFTVTGVDYPSGDICADCHYGSPVELTAYVRQPTTGEHSTDISSIGASSAATATVAGVAALVWSRYPWMSRDSLRQHMRWSGHLYPNKDGNRGWGNVQAHKAVGGMWYADIGCGNRTDCSFFYKLSACTSTTFSVSHKGGDGPFTYRWSTGGTGQSTSMTLCPTAGSIARYSISVTVTDTYDGTPIYRNAEIEVTSSDPDGACPTCPK